MGRASAHPDPVECLRLLGLQGGASAGQIKQAYRRLAQRFHPDKCGGDEVARRHFVAICMAYRTLMRNLRLAAENTPVGRCSVCGDFGEVVIGMDGLTRCPICALRPSRRLFLPLPTFTIAKCVGAFVMLGLSLYLALLAAANENLTWALASIAAGLGTLVALAITCVRVPLCIRPHEAKIRQQARHCGHTSR